MEPARLDSRPCRRHTVSTTRARDGERCAEGAGMEDQAGARGVHFPRGPRITRRRLLQVAGGGVVATAGAAALYRALAVINPPARTAASAAPARPGAPPGGYPAGQYQVADYGVRVRPDPDSAVVVAIPPMWNLVITATLARAPGMPEQRRLEAALGAVEAAYAYAPS